MTAWGWDVGKRVGGRFCTSASFSAAAPGVDAAQAYGRHPVTHGTQSWLSAGADGLHRLLALSCSDVHTQKSSACSWVVHLGIILSNKKP